MQNSVDIKQAAVCVPLHLLMTLCVMMTISIFHGCMVWIEKSVTRVTDRHLEAC